MVHWSYAKHDTGRLTLSEGQRLCPTFTMSHLVLDTQTIAKHKKQTVYERTKQVADNAVKRDWESNFVTHAPDGDRPTTSLEAQLGRPLTRIQIEQRLKKCNPNLFIETSIADPTKAGVYTVAGVVDELGVIRKQKQFLTGLENGFSPEFSVRHIEYEEVPNPSCPGEMTKRPKFKGETRGYRTVLAALIRSRHITIGSASEHFNLSSGQNSRNWQLLTTK